MKVSEYIPLYGLLFNFEYQTGMEGKAMTVNELFDNYPDFELTDTHLDQLYYFDLASLQTALKDEYFTPENVTTYLRRLFDSYREAGGNPFEWLHGTFESVNLNPQNYKVELRATLEKTLIEWIEIFKKQPIDSLYYYTNPEALPPQPIKTKADILKEQLSQYGFFELEKVKTLSEQSKVSIIEKIAESGLPYAIAMFDYLQFIPYLEKKHFDSKYKLNREVSKWFDSDKEGRAVKGNISSLLKNTTENKDRYTAYKHKENVIKDYELLK